MGRPPIEGQAMSAAERQRRHRARLRHKPWLSRRKTFPALAAAIRSLQAADGEASAVLTVDQVDAIVAATIEHLEIPARGADDAVDAASAYLSELLDPDAFEEVERQPSGRRAARRERREQREIGRKIHAGKAPRDSAGSNAEAEAES